MKEIYVEIRFNNIDRSKDGYITLKEHIGQYVHRVYISSCRVI